jgi:hypothetical protein
MRDEKVRAIITPKNEFLEKKQELFNLYLKMPVQFKEDWISFRKRCKKQGFEFKNLMGNLIIQFNKEEIAFKEYPVQDDGMLNMNAP